LGERERERERGVKGRERCGYWRCRKKKKRVGDMRGERRESLGFFKDYNNPYIATQGFRENLRKLM
jgi:hypothetical protein